MNPNREELLFQLALTKQATERSLFLERECGDDKALRQRLEALLAAHEQPETLLATRASGLRRDELHESPSRSQGLTEPSPPREAPDEAVGQTLGRYKLLEQIGEGGCGVVYVAEQTEPVRRRVALKVIKLAMDMLLRETLVTVPSRAGSVFRSLSRAPSRRQIPVSRSR